MRPVDPNTLTLPKEYGHVAAACLDMAWKPHTWTQRRYEGKSGGTRMPTDFRVPAKRPRFLVKGLRKHKRAETAGFTKSLPQL